MSEAPETQNPGILAWKSAPQAMARGPAVFVLAAVLLLTITVVAGETPRPTARPPEFGIEFARFAGLYLLRSGLECWVLAIVAVAAHRFVLCEEVPSLAAICFRRVALFATALFAFEAINWIISLAITVQPLTVMAIHLAVIFVSVRLVLMFPGIAVDVSKPIQGSWSVSRGRFWEIVAAIVIGLLPLIVVSGVLTVTTGPFWTHPGRSLSAIGYDAIWAAVKVVGTVVGASISSWVYRHSSAAVATSA